jgi:hypothetical protein
LRHVFFLLLTGVIMKNSILKSRGYPEENGRNWLFPSLFSLDFLVNNRNNIDFFHHLQFQEFYLYQYLTVESSSESLWETELKLWGMPMSAGLAEGGSRGYTHRLVTNYCSSWDIIIVMVGFLFSVYLMMIVEWCSEDRELIWVLSLTSSVKSQEMAGYEVERLRYYECYRAASFQTEASFPIIQSACLSTC